jgi:hypothetical protein
VAVDYAIIVQSMSASTADDCRRPEVTVTFGAVFAAGPVTT